ncbi:MAG: RNA polymerase sigma factor [Pyrinomonadaceae bacterium]
MKTETVSDNVDLILARACATGDASAQEKIYSDYRSKVFSVCRRFVSDIETAEDLTQEVFLQIYKKISSFKGESKLSTWIHRIAVNQSLMHLRRRNIIYFKSIDEIESHLLPSVPGSENRLRLNINDKILLASIIKELPKGYRNVFVLHDIEGFEHEEIARLLNCSVGTSKSQLHKARLKLRQLINKKANPRLSGFALEG